MSKEYNERKLEVLIYARDYEPITSQNVADDLDIEIHNARMLLLKYHRQGLLSRRSEFERKIYNISDKGLSRIEYLIINPPFQLKISERMEG